MKIIQSSNIINPYIPILTYSDGWMGSPWPQMTSCVIYGVAVNLEVMFTRSVEAISEISRRTHIRRKIHLEMWLTFGGIQSQSVNTEREQVIGVLSQTAPHVVVSIRGKASNNMIECSTLKTGRRIRTQPNLPTGRSAPRAYFRNWWCHYWVQVRNNGSLEPRMCRDRRSAYMAILRCQSRNRQSCGWRWHLWDGRSRWAVIMIGTLTEGTCLRWL